MLPTPTAVGADCLFTNYLYEGFAVPRVELIDDVTGYGVGSTQTHVWLGTVPVGTQIVTPGPALTFSGTARYAYGSVVIDIDATGSTPGAKLTAGLNEVLTLDPQNPLKGTLTSPGWSGTATGAEVMIYASLDGLTTMRTAIVDYPTGNPTPTPTPTPNPPGQAAVHRIGGGDRYETARMVSQAQWKAGTANAVVLARGDAAPDALAGVPLAAHVHGPLLLTDPKGMDAATSAEIARVTGGPSPDKTVYILGGDAAVSPSIESGLRAAGYHVVRYKGGDRYGTALAVAGAFGNTSHVIVATGQNFPDALAAGPLGAVENAPIVLSDDNTFDAATAAFVQSHAAIDPVGGFAQRAVATLNTAGKTVDKALSGPTRYDTAVAVGRVIAQVTGHAPTGVGVASSVTFPDALTGGAYAANAGMPLLITEPGALSDSTRFQLSGWANSLVAVEVFGGRVAVSDGVMNDVARTVHGRIQ
ncbi:cell wall-binding repeat-containing protein [Catenulispora subtropica]|uniref:cell wall-binding repeat-containing protein n=1 Tax=Catenulispora subtropica TaxID=450798 RepID=UPI0031E18251